MKKMLPLLIVTVLLSCHSNTSDKVENFRDTSGSASTPGAENVNGNVPDSTPGINLGHPLPVDSSRGKDSTKKDAVHH